MLPRAGVDLVASIGNNRAINMDQRKKNYMEGEWRQKNHNLKKYNYAPKPIAV